MQKYKLHDKIEKRKLICNTDLRINVKLVRVYYGRWHAHNLTEDQGSNCFSITQLVGQKRQ